MQKNLNPFAALIWGGLMLRDARVRALAPWRQVAR